MERVCKVNAPEVEEAWVLARTTRPRVATAIDRTAAGKVVVELAARGNDGAAVNVRNAVCHEEDGAMVSLTHKRHHPGTVHYPDEISRMPDRFVHPRFRLLQGDSNTSLAECSRMVQLDPEDPQAYRDRGIVYLSKGNYRRRSRYISAWRQRCFDKAITDFTTAIRACAQRCQFVPVAGYRIQSKRPVGSSHRRSTEAIRLEPKGPQGLRRTERAHEQKGEMDEAKADSAKAEQLAMSLW